MHMVKLTTKIYVFVFIFYDKYLWASDNVYYFSFASTWKCHAVIVDLLQKAKSSLFFNKNYPFL